MTIFILAATALFWGALGLILLTYLGFPILLAMRGWLRPRLVRRGNHTPHISVVIVAHNEADVIIQRLDNIFALDYPRQCLEVIVASDGSDDSTEQLVAQYNPPAVRLLALPRRGKNLTLNAAVAEARGEIVVLSDADSTFASDALRHLVAPFHDPRVGGVIGDYRYPGDIAEADGERTYWRLDRILKRLQGRGGNVTSATGQIYAIRRGLFQPVPMGVTDDFFTSSQVPAAHKWLIFEPRAVAYGPIADSSEAEFRRKVRIITRGLRSVWAMRRLLNPFEYGFYAIQLLSHKFLRRLMVVPLLLLAMSAPLLWGYGWPYRWATLCQLLLHTLGTLGFVLRRTRLGRLKVLSLPLFFELVNVACGVAIVNILRGKRYDTWAPERSESIMLPDDPSHQRDDQRPVSHDTVYDHEAV